MVNRIVSKFQNCLLAVLLFSKLSFQLVIWFIHINWINLTSFVWLFQSLPLPGLVQRVDGDDDEEQYAGEDAQREWDRLPVPNQGFGGRKRGVVLKRHRWGLVRRSQALIIVALTAPLSLVVSVSGKRRLRIKTERI